MLGYRKGNGMDWHMIVVGAVGFAAGMATVIMLAAMVAAGQADRHMGAARQHPRSTQNTHTDTQST